MKPKEIKYSKDLEWLIPFVNNVSHIVPIDMIKSIRTYKIKPGLKSQTYGSIIIKKNSFSINICAYAYQEDTEKYRSETIAVILDTLAHELSHMLHLDHSYKHFKTQALILLKFSRILKKLRISDTSARFNNLG